ncbi:hypothetical protein JCM10207_007205 [Rhodosporidiobolus poonsookiae]
MVNENVFLAAIIVPPVCVVLIVLWTTLFYFRVRRVASSRAQFRNSVSYPSPPHLPPLGTLPHRRSTSTPFPLPSTPTAADGFVPFRRAPLPPSDVPYLPSPQPPSPNFPYSPPPPPEPSPSESRFAIATTVSRTGSRVLTRATSSNNSHGTAVSGGSGGEGRKEKWRSKPEKAKRVKEQFGIGSADDDLEDGDGRVHDDTVIVDIVTSSPPGLRRRATLGAEELEHVVHAGSLAPPPPSPHAPSLPGYTSKPPSPSDGFGGSHESGVALLTDARRSDDQTEELRGEMAQVHGRRVIVHDLRDVRGRVTRSAAAEQDPPLPHHPPDRRWSAVSSIYANPDDDYTISAASVPQGYFSTAIVPLPPASPSPSSSSHGRSHPVEQLKSGWSSSSHEAQSDTARLSHGSSVYQIARVPPPALYPLQSTPLHGSKPSPSPLELPSPVGPTQTVRNSTASSAALEELEHYAASLSSSGNSFPAIHNLATTSQSPLQRQRSRRQNSAPWFADDSVEGGHAPPQSGETAFKPRPSDIEELDTSAEKELILQKARRPISWLMRKGSEGTLPDGVDAVGNFQIVNPDEHSLRQSTSSGYGSA